MINSDTLIIAKITGAQGIQGALRLHSYTANPLDIEKYQNIFDSKGKQYNITSARLHKNEIVIIKIKDCIDRNMAEALKGTELFINKAELAPAADEEFYYNDLIGMKVIDQDNKQWGTIKNVANFGAGDILDIIGPDVEFMIPFTKDAVPTLQLGAGQVIINKEYIVLPNKDEDVAG